MLRFTWPDKISSELQTLSRSTDTSFGNPHRFTHSSAVVEDEKLHATFEEVRISSSRNVLDQECSDERLGFFLQVTQAPLDSPVGSTPNVAQALEASHPVAAVPTTNPNEASSEKAKDVSPTPTITPHPAQSQLSPGSRSHHIRSPGKSEGKGGGLASLGWKASMFEDRVLCQLFEMIGRPGLEDEVSPFHTAVALPFTDPHISLLPLDSDDGPGPCRSAHVRPARRHCRSSAFSTRTSTPVIPLLIYHSFTVPGWLYLSNSRRYVIGSTTLGR